MYSRFFIVFVFSLLTLAAIAQPITIQKGMVIDKSTTIQARYYTIPALEGPVITIQGENIVVDFNGAVLDGATEQLGPDKYNGLAIEIKDGKNITIKNLSARGYRVALMAENVEGLVIENSDLSYNYRQRLYSMREREDLSDWLSYHQNEKDEWLRYGAAVYLKDCNKAQIHDVRITQGQNGIMLVRCNDGLFYNNDIRFNSGIGIGLYRSSRNKVMHNRLDWNVRGYSHGFYSRGQDSAAILCYEQSNDNVFAYNSATHSGDGFFLWAGQSTMDTGEGGCNNNMLYANDFSHSPTNGVEVTFSSNQIIGNRLDECTYGVWGGYSYQTLIAGNRITNCQHGIAIEHGQNNTIANNYFADNQTGVWLWQRKEQPTDWGYAQNRDVMSRDYNLWRNAFVSVKTPLKIAGTRKVIINDNNEFYHYQQLLQEEQPNENRFLVKNNFYVPEQLTSAIPEREKNRLIQEATITDTTVFEQVLQLPDWVQKKIPAPLPDGIDASLPKDHPRGRRYMLVNEWGPYNFEYPAIWLRELKDGLFTFDIMGPQGRMADN
jgi:parallel beta-helix repeat protein